MLIAASAKDFAKAAREAASVVDAKVAAPILANLLVTTGDATVSFAEAISKAV